MNTDILQGKWRQLKGEARVQWGKLTDDDLDQVQGQAEKLVGLVQERYGYDRQQAEREVDSFVQRYGRPCSRRAVYATGGSRRCRRCRQSDPRHVLAQRGGQIDQVLLLLPQNFADVLGHGEFVQRLALPRRAPGTCGSSSVSFSRSKRSMPRASSGHLDGLRRDTPAFRRGSRSAWRSSARAGALHRRASRARSRSSCTRRP